VWYKKKRIWLVVVLFALFFITKMEWAKMRYDRTTLMELLTQNKGSVSSYDTRKIKDRTIHFIKRINDEKLPLLVMVHGSPGALNAYEEYLRDDELNSRANMIAVDRPGFGYSDFGKMEPSLTVQAALIAKILKDFPNQKKILMGHSMGGAVISKITMDFPELVDGLVMVAPAISPDLEPSNTWRKVVDFPLIRWFTPSALRVCNQEIIPLRKELEGMMDGWESIEIPVTVIQGEEDPLVPKGNAFFAKDIMSENTQVKTRMIKGGNHFILWSEIPLIKTELFEMLEKVGE